MRSNDCSSELLPVNSLQRTMLFTGRMAPGRGLNLEQVLLRLNRRLDADTLQESVRKVFEHHEALRSIFEWEAGREPVQRLTEDCNLVWEHRELPNSFGNAVGEGLQAEWDQVLEQYLAKDRAQDVNPEKAPLHRFCFFSRSPSVVKKEHEKDPASELCSQDSAPAKQERGDSVLVWTFPHAVLDGRSIERVLVDILSAYDALATGRGWDPPAAEGIREYATWLKSTQLTPDQREAEAYWKRTFDGFTPPESWTLGAAPETRSDADGRTPPMGEIEEVWDAEFTASLVTFCARWNGTLNTLLQGAFAFVLSRYSGVDDLLMAAVRNGRHWAGSAHPDAVGLFMNNLPVRFTFQPELTVQDWLQNLRRQHVEIRPFEQTPMERIQEWISWPRGTPLFETVFQYEPGSFTDRLRAALPGWNDVEVELREYSGVPLILSVEGSRTLRLKLEYDSARFQARILGQLLAHLRMVCETFCACPDADIFALALPAMDGEMRAPVGLDDPLSLSVPFPTRTVLEWITDQAQQRPQAVAIERGPETLSYGELDRLSSQLANHLRSQFDQAPAYIALCAERSPMNLVGLLGILKAGAAVVSLDPGLPAARRDFILEDAGVELLLCDRAMATQWEGSTLTRWVLDVPESPWRAASDTPLPLPSLDAPSYLVYTSGTTGKPKGVINTHRGLSNEAVWAWRVFPVLPDERTLHMANLSFDAAFEEIFGTLLGGGTLVCRPPEAMDSMTHFHDALIRERITLLDLTTSFWAQWVAWMDREGKPLPETLRVMAVGGEKTQQSTYQIWQQLARGRVRWLNTYGPTEAAIVSTVYISPDQPEHCIPIGEVPIGRPLPHTFVRVLDAHRREVPAGTSGELYIGGVGVADGYLNRPDLTAKAFVPDPFGASATDTLYKTGDLVRMTADGELEYLGRADNQVKIRGFRIELDEVENAISAHADVAESVVVTLTEGNRISGLAAYVVRRNERLTLETLKTFLGERLPPYAVPGAVVFLPQMPLTGNGKVDRRALPAVESVSESNASTPPETPLQAELERMFARALRRERVGIDESFQQAGGDSFMVMELIELAMRAGYALHPESLIRYPTVRKLAAHLASKTAASPSQTQSDASTAAEAALKDPLSPLSVLREGPGPVLYLAHATPGDVMGYGNLVHHLREDQPVMGFSSLGLKKPEQAHETIEAMAGYYVEHLLRYQPEGPYHLAGWCYGGTVAYEMARQLTARGHTVAMLALIDCYAPMPVGWWDRWRVRGRRLQMLFRRSPVGQWAYVRSKLRPGSVPTLAEPTPSELPEGTHIANREWVRAKNMDAIWKYRYQEYSHSFDVYLSTQVGDNYLFDPTGGWSLFTSRAKYHHLDADHRAILKEPAVLLVAHQLQARLEAAREEGERPR